MSSDDTRASVLVGVCQQDPQRWHEFDAIYRPMLRAYLHRRGLEESEAGDLVQEVFFKVLCKIHTYDRARCPFRSWLFTLARERLLRPLNARLRRMVDRQGWTYVGGIFASFGSHGYAAERRTRGSSGPRSRSSDRAPACRPWATSAARSRPGCSTRPNCRGHHVIADRLFRSLATRTISPFRPAPAPAPRPTAQ